MLWQEYNTKYVHDGVEHYLDLDGNLLPVHYFFTSNKL